MTSSPTQLDALISQPYQHGFVTDVDEDQVPAGLSEEIIRIISARKATSAEVSQDREANP